MLVCYLTKLVLQSSVLRVTRELYEFQLTIYVLQQCLPFCCILGHFLHHDVCFFFQMCYSFLKLHHFLNLNILMKLSFAFRVHFYFTCTEYGSWFYPLIDGFLYSQVAKTSQSCRTRSDKEGLQKLIFSFFHMGVAEEIGAIFSLESLDKKQQNLRRSLDASIYTFERDQSSKFAHKDETQKYTSDGALESVRCHIRQLVKMITNLQIKPNWGSWSVHIPSACRLLTNWLLLWWKSSCGGGFS